MSEYTGRYVLAAWFDTGMFRAGNIATAGQLCAVQGAEPIETHKRA